MPRPPAALSPAFTPHPPVKVTRGSPAPPLWELMWQQTANAVCARSCCFFFFGTSRRNSIRIVCAGRGLSFHPISQERTETGRFHRKPFGEFHVSCPVPLISDYLNPKKRGIIKVSINFSHNITNGRLIYSPPQKECFWIASISGWNALILYFNLFGPKLAVFIGTSHYDVISSYVTQCSF